MLPLFCCLFLALGHSLASPSAEQYLDTVINSTLQNVIRNEKLDPIYLADFTFEYKDKTFFGNVKGKAEYTDGRLEGLSKVQRNGDCRGPMNVTDSTVIHCNLIFSRLYTSYKGRVKYGVLPKVSINAKGSVNDVQVDVTISRSLNTGITQASFGTNSYSGVYTDFTGLGPLNKHMKVLEENYRFRVGAEVVGEIDTTFQYAFNLASAQVPLPVR